MVAFVIYVVILLVIIGIAVIISLVQKSKKAGKPSNSSVVVEKKDIIQQPQQVKNVNALELIEIPKEYRKRTTIASNLYYDSVEIYNNKVVGYLDGQAQLSWYFKDYNGIDFVKANLNSQFAQVVFLTGINSKNRVVGIDFGSEQNINAMNDTNRILICAGMFSFEKSNNFAGELASKIRQAFNNYKNNEDQDTQNSNISVADELKKYKELLDSGTITQEEFNELKNKLINK